MSVSSIHSALITLVETTLQASDPAFNVVGTVPAALYGMPARSQRVAVMGDPARYCEVLWKRPNFSVAGSGFMTFGSEETQQTFEVGFFWQETADDATSWMDALGSLLATLDRTQYLIQTDDPRRRVMLHVPESTGDVVPMLLDSDGNERAHFFLFRISTSEQS